MSLRAGKSLVMSERGNLFAMLMNARRLLRPLRLGYFPLAMTIRVLQPKLYPLLPLIAKNKLFRVDDLA